MNFNTLGDGVWWQLTKRQAVDPRFNRLPTRIVPNQRNTR